MFTNLFFKPHYSTFTPGVVFGYTAIVHNLLTDRKTTHFFQAHEVSRLNIEAWQDGQLIQQAFPKLSVPQREFLISGIPLYEQDSVFKATASGVSSF